MEEVSDVIKIKEAANGRGRSKPEIWLLPKPSAPCRLPENAVGGAYTFCLSSEHSLASFSIHPPTPTTQRPHPYREKPYSLGLGVQQ